jgi:hypothetical protein
VPQDNRGDRVKEVMGWEWGRGMVEYCVLLRGHVRMYSFSGSEMVGDTSLGAMTWTGYCSWSDERSMLANGAVNGGDCAGREVVSAERRMDLMMINSQRTNHGGLYWTSKKEDH